MRRASLALTASVLLLWASSAGAAVTIGQASGTDVGCATSQSFVQETTVGGASYVAPISGVIVSWQHLSRAGAQPTVKLKVYDPTGDPTVWFLRSQSAEKTLTASSTNTFSESPGIPIQSDDHLGLTGLGGATMACFAGAAMGDVVRNNGLGGGDTVPGNNSLGGFSTFARVDAAATIEPDADGDGFGDESQDQCPADAALQAPPCATPSGSTPGSNPGGGSSADKTAPSVTLSSSDRQSVGKGLTVQVQSNEAGTASADASVNLPGTSRTVKFKTTTASLTAGVRKKLTLKLVKKNVRKVQRAIRKKKRPKAKVTITVKDVAGNASTSRTTIKLKR
jgi:hypothetical protein